MQVIYCSYGLTSMVFGACCSSEYQKRKYSCGFVICPTVTNNRNTRNSGTQSCIKQPPAPAHWGSWLRPMEAKDDSAQQQLGAPPMSLHVPPWRSVTKHDASHSFTLQCGTWPQTSANTGAKRRANNSEAIRKTSVFFEHAMGRLGSCLYLLRGRIV